ncbi:hypothetical protein ACQBAU_05155 [Propionibacteriaceae bacterium Y2011]
MALTHVVYYGYKLRDDTPLPPQDLFGLPIVRDRILLEDSLPAVERACQVHGVERINAFIAGTPVTDTSLSVAPDARFASSARLCPVDDCETCATVGVPSDGVIPWDIDATTEALIERVRAGRMIELRHDVPLEDMLALLESELKYTISSFVQCVDCGRLLFWGLCIRGNPILRCADRTEVDRWPWGSVPARTRWARR